MREVLVSLAKDHGLKLSRTYVRVGKRDHRKQTNYARARQFKRAARMQKRLKKYLFKVLNEIKSQIHYIKSFDDNFTNMIHLAERIILQERKSKNKVYSVHADEV